jgi:prepilin-type N-terminal cleavage/methylation domain-containing protein
MFWKGFPMKRKAFTVVELLVVIGIIALIVAILLPRFYTSQPVVGKVLEIKSVIQSDRYGTHSEEHTVVEISPHNTMELECNSVLNQLQIGHQYQFQVRNNLNITSVTEVQPPER